ncbi:MAG: D-glycero-beta-D-manno-heptose-7-phosphate kinase [Desulfovibrionales bacterium]
MTDAVLGSPERAVSRLTDSPVLIVGDVMLDHYQYGVVERISPEAPVPVVQVQKEEYKLGGASNVAKNILTLGGIPRLLSVCGNCGREKGLIELLEQNNIDFSFVTEEGRRTTAKTRVIAQNQQVVRVDHESSEKIKNETASRILELIEKEVDTFPVIILSDYGKGVICRTLLEGLQRICRNRRKPPLILVDPKVRNFSLYKNVSLLTPNTMEASQSTGMEINARDDVLRAGMKIFQKLDCEHLVITLGPEGMAFFESPGKVWRIPTLARKVFDVTGAGDTVIAVLGLAFSAGLGLKESCILANYAAGIVVGQLGTASVTRSELIESIQKLPSVEIEPWLTG